MLPLHGGARPGSWLRWWLAALALAGGLAPLGVLAIEPPPLLASFSSDVPTDLVAIAYDEIEDEIYILHDGDPLIRRLDFAGTPVGTLPLPFSGGSNTIDLDFAPVAFEIGTTPVPANALLISDDVTDRVYAVEKTSGALIAQFAPGVSGSIVGGALSAADLAMYLVAFDTDTVTQVDPAIPGPAGVGQSFPLNPVVTPPSVPPEPFDVFFGDIEVLGGGILAVVGSAQDSIRLFTSDGRFLGDIHLQHLGIGSFSGIAIDDGRGEIWLASTDGGIHQLPEPGVGRSLLAGALGLLPMARRRRGPLQKPS